METMAWVYIGSTLLGALVGGLVTLATTQFGERRKRRVRYGEKLLDALNALERKISVAAPQRLSEANPLDLREEVLSFWVHAELAATLERRHGRRAMRGWAQNMYNLAGSAISTEAQLELLRHRLNMSEFLVIAWTAGYARGADFSSSDERIIELYDPAR